MKGGITKLTDFLKKLLAGILEEQKKTLYATNNNQMNGKIWHGVLLSDLNKIAKEIRYNPYNQYYISVDGSNFLVFNWSSHSRKTRFKIQCVVRDGRLERLSQGYYVNQYRDDADVFIEEANKRFQFR